MRILLDVGLFATPVVSSISLELLTIFHLGFERRHAILLDFDPSTAQSYQQWLNQRPSYESDTINGAVRHGLQSDARDVIDTTIAIKPIQHPQWTQLQLPTKTAVSILTHPIEILVEDSINDQAFLRAIAVGPQRDTFEQFITNGWIRFVHGGGLPRADLEIGRGNPLKSDRFSIATRHPAAGVIEPRVWT